MTANAGFNGTTISFASETTTPLLSIDYGSSGAKVQTSGSDDTQKTYVSGVPDDTITYSVVGSTSTEVGDTGAVAITFSDDTTPSITFSSGVCVEVSISGSEDSPITSTVTVVPYAATG
jgi:hypothetical protein